MTSIDVSGVISITQTFIDHIIHYSINGEISQDINSWPVTFINTNSPESFLIVSFDTSGIVLDIDTNQFFICGSKYIKFEGNYNSIIIGIDNYPGLIQNGTSNKNGYSHILIQNIGIITSNNDFINLISKGGWIGQSYFGKGIGFEITCKFINCYSTGNIGSNTNGLCGGICGYASSSISFEKCHSSGIITSGSGGIASRENTASVLTNCYSTGDINNGSSGIFPCNNTFSSIQNCFSTGNINNNSAGISANGGNGVFGNISNSYSTGNISNTSGGIVYNGVNDINNCYSVGIIDKTSGGICTPGLYAQAVINSYWNGTNDNKGAGTTGKLTNCYGYESTWSDTIANSLLTGTDGSIWVDVNLKSSNIPYLLASFNSQLYNPNQDSTNNSQYISNQGIIPNTNYSVISVNDTYSTNPSINIIDGKLTFINLQLKVYQVKVFSWCSNSKNNYFNYNINNFTLSSNYQPPIPKPIIQLTPKVSPIIIKITKSQKVNLNDEFNLKVKVIGSKPIYYQWYFNNKKIKNAKSKSYKIKSFSSKNVGKYYVKVSNNIETTKSKNIYLGIKINYLIIGIIIFLLRFIYKKTKFLNKYIC